MIHEVARAPSFKLRVTESLPTISLFFSWDSSPWLPASSEALSLSPSACPSASCSACCRLSLWQTSKAWPTVRTMRIAWVWRVVVGFGVTGQDGRRVKKTGHKNSAHTKVSHLSSHLLLGLEDVAPEGVARTVSGNVAENLQVLRVVRHVENPKKKKGANSQDKPASVSSATRQKFSPELYLLRNNSR